MSGHFVLSSKGYNVTPVFILFCFSFQQVDDVQLNLEKERAQVSALEKKQRKFDQVHGLVVVLWRVVSRRPI